MSAIPRPSILAVLLPVTLVACEIGGVGDAGDPTVADSAGVTIVENRGPDRPLESDLTEIARLVPPDSALTAFPWGVAADPATGRIYVADRTSARIVVFDRDGAYVGTYGREGEGPGEFVNVSAISVGPHGSLTAWDTGRGILSRWSSAGDLLNEARPPVSHWGPGVHDAPDRLVTVTSETSGSAMQQVLVEVTADDTTSLQTVSRALVRAELPCTTQPVPRLFSPSVVWTAAGDTVYALSGPGYRIDAYVDGEPVASLRRRVDPVEVTSGMAEERARLQFGDFLDRCGVTPGRFVEAVGHEDRIAPIQWMAVDPRGRLWLSRSSDGVGTEQVDLLDAGGRYRGSLETDAMPVAFVSDTRIVGLTRTPETGEVALVLHDLRAPDGDSDPGDAVAADDRPPRAPEPRSDLREFRDCPGCPLMVELPTGSYRMGAPRGEWPAAGDPTRPEWTVEAERPQVEVTIDHGFAIGKYEVTFEEWIRCVEAGGCDHEPDDEGWGRDDRPVIHVSRSDAKQYVGWLSERTGETYRLPSEAEWEYAARAGTETAYWWGDAPGDGRIACDGCGSRWDDRSTAPVGSFPANPWGLHDMLTNVSEWTADCWHDTHEGNPGDGSARAESSEWWREEGWEDRRGEPCRRPVKRGGTYSSYPWANRAAWRTYYWPHPNWTERESYTRGFRVAREFGEPAGTSGPPPPRR